MHGGVRISYMHFRFALSANSGHASWHLKETMARTGVYNVKSSNQIMVMATHVNSTIFFRKGGVKCAQALPPR